MKPIGCWLEWNQIAFIYFKLQPAPIKIWQIHGNQLKRRLRTSMEILWNGMAPPCPSVLRVTEDKEKELRLKSVETAKLKWLQDKCHIILGVLLSTNMIPSTYTRDGKWVSKTSWLGDQQQQVLHRSELTMKIDMHLLWRAWQSHLSSRSELAP